MLDLAAELGITESQVEARWGVGAGALLSIVPFVYGLSSALAITGAYIVDNYRGHPLIRMFVSKRVNPITVEWMLFLGFIGLPGLVAGAILLTGSNKWWDYASLFWFSRILVFYVVFVVHVVWYELSACFELSRCRQGGGTDSFWKVVRYCIMARQASTYGGQKTITYLSTGILFDPEYKERSSCRKRQIAGSYSETENLSAKAVRWSKCLNTGWFERLDQPKRIYAIEDTREIRPYVTADTWNLEKVFCRPRNSRYIAVIKGPGSITRAQLRSSFVCSIIGTFLILFLVISTFVYWSLSMGAIFLVLIVGLLLFWSALRSSYRFFKSVKNLLLFKEGTKVDGEVATNGRSSEELNSWERQATLANSESEGIYFVQEKYRLFQPSDKASWILFILEGSLLFVYPLLSLILVSNWHSVGLFILIAGVSGIRYYISATVLLQEIGHLRGIRSEGDEESWTKRSRLNEIVGNVSFGRSRQAWATILATFGFIAAFVLIMAANTRKDQVLAGGDTGYTYLPSAEFSYIQKESLRYPSCELTSDLGKTPLKFLVRAIWISS